MKHLHMMIETLYGEIRRLIEGTFHTAVECHTLVQLSVSGLHCRRSLTMVALPFSTAQ